MTLIKKEKLSDVLARAIKDMIDREGFVAGDRLPTIAEMAEMFGVGAPTLREALKRLQATAVVDIRHGAGVFVAKHHDSLFVNNTVAQRKPSKKVILDLMEARIAVEPYAAGLAVVNATEPQIAIMEELLEEARRALDNGEMDTLAEANLAFHREISLASHNSVISQLLALITGLFQIELYAILDIYGSTEQDHIEHRGILAAIKRRNRSLAVRKMRNHLENVRVAIEEYYEIHQEETNL
jgi:GntR family transcriptional repressor for pyruvate dehydrogenase complex